MHVYKLHFTSPLHLGVDGIDGQEKVEEMLRSDTIFSAIMSTWGLLFDDDIESLCENSPFIVSSAFPFIGKQRFYPGPIGIFDEIIREDDGDKKFWKKIDFIPEAYIKTFLKKGKLSNDELLKLKSFIRDQEATEDEIAGGMYRDSRLAYRAGSERPRLGIDRLTSSVRENAFFYSRDVVFAENSGLFFLIEFFEESIQDKFDAVMRLLGDNGIGADRSIGRGQFVFSKEEIDLKTAGDGKNGYLLSCYLPEREEVEEGVLENSSYNLISRSGYVYDYRMRNTRRQQLTMLSEGSIISHVGRNGGMVACVCNKDKMDIPHNVYRNGKAFLLEVEGG